nr:restriction endonuclease subunit S [Vibrio harveyi]
MTDTMIKRMSKYESYKESNVDWIGKIPKEWDVVRLGGLFRERRTKVSDLDFPALSVTKKGILPQLDSAAKTKDGDNRKLVKCGDFVINSRSDRKGSSGVSDRDGSVSLINIVLEPQKIEATFCHHLLKSNAFIEEYYRVGRGIVADLWTTRYDEMRTISLALPSKTEQVAIARFLDEKTAQIDEAIAIKQKQIELLKERKQIIIQQAVTQGLNPDSPMKDSGVDWIGKLPKHWTVKKVKHIVDFCGGGTPNKENSSFWGGDIPWVSPKDMKQLHIYDSIDKITPKALKRSSVKLLPENTVLIVVRGMILAKKIPVAITKKEVTINQDMKGMLVKGGFNANYLLFLLDGLHEKLSLLLEESGHGTKTFPTDKLATFELPIPPEHEQVEIIDFLESENLKFSTWHALIEDEISKLTEYKTTLINSAVTGKIKVTELA